MPRWTVRIAMSFFFFFQAEDGIRDRDVTGVQTCALPIWLGRDPHGPGVGNRGGRGLRAPSCSRGSTRRLRPEGAAIARPVGRAGRDSMAVRFGIIGSGYISRGYAAGLKIGQVPDGELVAIAGGRRAPALAEEFGAEVESSVDALIERED